MKQFKKFLAVLLVLCLVCSFAFAAVLANHPGHSCQSGGCPICAMIKTVGTLLSTVSRLAAVGFVFAALMCLGTVLEYLKEKLQSHYKTPVSLKVKISS